MALFSATATVPQNLTTFASSNKLSFSLPPSSNFLSFPSFQSNPCNRITTSSKIPRAHAPPSPSATTSSSISSFHGLCYVVGDNIDTDQIIPAEHLTLVPSKPDEYEKLGSFALIGLPASYAVRFVEPGETKTKYSVIIAGANFGCGSSREHAPVALGASGTAAVVAESYARIFFRNSVATGEVYPLESEGRLCDECRTGDVVTVELAENRLINHTTGKEYRLKPIGDAGPVIEAGGIFCLCQENWHDPFSLRKDMDGACKLFRTALQVLPVRAVNSVILASDDMQDLLHKDDPLLKKCIDPLDALAQSTIKWARSFGDNA